MIAERSGLHMVDVAASLYVELRSGSRDGFGSFGHCRGREAVRMSVNFTQPVGSLGHPTGYKKAQVITCFYQRKTKKERRGEGSLL